jgi:hypothetical protein
MSNVRFTNDILSRQTLVPDLGGAELVERLPRNVACVRAISRPARPVASVADRLTAAGLREDAARADLARFFADPEIDLSNASAWAQTTDSALGNVTDLPLELMQLHVHAFRDDVRYETSLDAVSPSCAVQGVAAAGERDVQRALHLLRHGDEHPAVPVNAYSGTTLPVQRLIGAGQVIQVNKDGPSAFGVSRPARRPRRTCSTCSTTSSATSTREQRRARLERSDRVDGSCDGGQRADHGRCDLQSARSGEPAERAGAVGTGAAVADEDADMAKTLITYSTTQTAYQAAPRPAPRSPSRPDGLPHNMTNPRGTMVKIDSTRFGTIDVPTTRS